VTSPSSISAAFTGVKNRFNGRLDVVVNNAGYSLSGDTEAATEEEMHDELETLFFGAARVSMRAVEMMRPKTDQGGGDGAGGGLVMNISSLAGLVGLPGHAYYHAGKWALEGWTESVAREMSPDWGSMSLPSYIPYTSLSFVPANAPLPSFLLPGRTFWRQNLL
jgi:NAD(P)-dependent dehydrogenase (short-subunit alcohol dehydrogenase family)